VKSKRGLTHLESIALGIVWKFDGCTAYEVMSEFSNSLTAQFQSRAGSIYPLMKRLHQEKFLSRKQAKRGQQEKKIYTITDDGIKALENWLTPPLSEGEIGLNTDPVRSRVYFLGILPKRKQIQFIDNVLEKLKVELKSIKSTTDEYATSDNEFGFLAMMGAVYVARARIRWLQDVRKLI